MKFLLSAIPPVVLTALLASCAAPTVQMYEGELADTDRAVISTVDDDLWVQAVGISSIDGKMTQGLLSNMVSTKWPSRVYVTPGLRHIGVTYLSGRSHATVVLCLYAEAGGWYVAKARPDGYVVKFWLEDERTGKPVGGIPGGCRKPKEEAKPKEVNG